MLGLGMCKVAGAGCGFRRGCRSIATSLSILTGYSMPLVVMLSQGLVLCPTCLNTCSLCTESRSIARYDIDVSTFYHWIPKFIGGHTKNIIRASLSAAHHAMSCKHTWKLTLERRPSVHDKTHINPCGGADLTDMETRLHS